VAASVANEKDVLQALSEAAAKIAPEVLATLRPNEVRTTRAAPRWSWVPAAVVGVASLAAGTGMMVSVSGRERALRGAPGQPSMLGLAEAQRQLSMGNDEQAAAIACFVAAGIGVAAAVVLFVLGREVPATASAWLTGDGGGLAFGGRF
jgi:hypothetical protein